MERPAFLADPMICCQNKRAGFDQFLSEAGSAGDQVSFVAVL
jgi:hypothetical protein